MNTKWLDVSTKLSIIPTDEIINHVITKIRETTINQHIVKMQLDINKEISINNNNFHDNLKSKYQTISTTANSIAHYAVDDLLDEVSLTRLYDKMLDFVIKYTSTNTSNNDNNEINDQEIILAFESVYSRSGVYSYIKLSMKQKNEQLLELARIVLGIRVYNKHEGKGGEDMSNIHIDTLYTIQSYITDITTDLNLIDADNGRQESNIIQSFIHKRRQELIKEVELKRVSNIIGDQTFSDDLNDLNDDVPVVPVVAVPSQRAQVEDSSSTTTAAAADIHHPAVEEAQEKLIENISQLAYNQQYTLYLHKFLTYFRAVESNLKRIKLTLSTECIELQDIVGSKAAVSKDNVYPKFTRLGQLWYECIEENMRFKSIRKAYDYIVNTYRHRFLPHDLPSLSTLSEVGDGPTSRAVVSTTTTSEIGSISGKEVDVSSTHTGCEILYPHNNSALLSSIHLMFNGFCAWALTDKNGLLVRGRPEVGIVCYKNQYFAFESSSGLQAFIVSPDVYIHRIQSYIILHPEYLYLLSLEQWFPREYTLLFASEGFTIGSHSTHNSGGTVQCDASTETPIHFIERNIDTSHYWNEWDMRRQVLKLVNLQNCKTHSTQTINSHYRRENHSQVYLPKNNETQTKRDTGTNPKLVTAYLAGTNGMRDPLLPAGQVSRYIKPTSTTTTTTAYTSTDSARGSGRVLNSGGKGNRKDKPVKGKHEARVVTLTLDL